MNNNVKRIYISDDLWEKFQEAAKITEFTGGKGVRDNFTGNRSALIQAIAKLGVDDLIEIKKIINSSTPTILSQSKADKLDWLEQALFNGDTEFTINDLRFYHPFFRTATLNFGYSWRYGWSVNITIETGKVYPATQTQPAEADIDEKYIEYSGWSLVGLVELVEGEGLKFTNIE